MASKIAEPEVRNPANSFETVDFLNVQTPLVWLFLNICFSLSNTLAVFENFYSRSPPSIM
jgi:hypothetical protein